ncbi:MAG: Glucosidase YgjK [Syntrophomonadaceae bacterium]|nr:Glucosidase YgjK [Bacillota bacterium]
MSPEFWEIRFSVFTPKNKDYTSKFYFLEHFSDLGNVLQITHHNLNCRYASCMLSFSGCIFKIEYVNLERGKLLCKITPVSISDSFSLILVEVKKAWGEDKIELRERKIFGENLVVYPFYDYHSKYHCGEPVTFGIYENEDEIKNALILKGDLNNSEGNGKIAVSGFYLRLPIYVLVNIDKKIDVEKEIEIAKRETEENMPKILGGPFDKSAQIITTCINWCVVYDKINERPYTPVCRSWIDEYGVRIGIDKDTKGPMIAVWDSLLNALLHSIENLKLAEENIKAVLDDYYLCEEGYPPNYVALGLKSGDRSQPPIGSLVVWKIYQKYKNLKFLRWAYPRLKNWHKWWFKRRDGNKDGLLEYGSTYGIKNPGNDPWCTFACACESGMDNSPLYDEAVYDKNTSTLNLIDIGLNSLITADTLYLSKIAKELANYNEEKEFLEEYKILKEKINKELFDEKRKIYCDKFWEGKFSSHLAPTCFYPLLASIPSEKLAKDIVKNYLLNRKKFWGDYILPSISRNDPAFFDQLYWRGRIWPSMNYLVWVGLKEYGFDDVSYRFAKKCFSLFKKEWEINSHCHENYNALTGEGCDVPIKEQPYSFGSDRFYSWGALLCLVGLEELIDVELDEGIRFGCKFCDEKTVISNIKLQNSLYHLEQDKNKLIAKRNNKIFYQSEPMTQVRNYIKGKNLVKFRVSGKGMTEFKIYEFPKGMRVEVLVNNLKKVRKVNDVGALKFKENLKDEYLEVKISKTV